MASKEMLRRWAGGGWPADDFGLEANRADLAEHQNEHDSRVAYTFTMLNPAEDECLGCVYIDPFYRYLELVGDTLPARETPLADFEAVVRFWVRQPRLIDNLDRRLFQALTAWISKDWAFSQVFFRINSRDGRQVALVEETDLRLHYTLDVPDRHGKYLLYGVIRPTLATDSLGRK